MAAVRQTENETVAEAVAVLRSLLRSDDPKLCSIVGRALLALREKRLAEEPPVIVEAIEDLSRVTKFLESHSEQQVDRVLAAVNGDSS